MASALRGGRSLHAWPDSVLLMTRFVAEIGSNHIGDFERAIALIEAAAACGFSDAKTQAWTVEGLYAPEALSARPELLERKKLEMPWEWHKPLANRCKELGLGYGASVFQAYDVRRTALEADWLKVSSYSILDGELLAAVALQPKPMVVSTGMATESEIQRALDGIEAMHPELTLLHCVSSYPAPPYEANLRSIHYMRTRFGVPVGWSDHTCSPFVIGRAVYHGAEMVELHWDLDDRRGAETAHSWTPHSFRDFLASPSAMAKDPGYFAPDGKAGIKSPSVSEHTERAWRADPSDGLRPLLRIRASL